MAKKRASPLESRKEFVHRLVITLYPHGAKYGDSTPPTYAITDLFSKEVLFQTSFRAMLGIHMNSPAGTIASLHLHPITPGGPFETVQEVEVVEGKGVLGDHRYFGRLSRKTGEPTRRQVSLIEREQIAEHAIALGLPAIPPGAVRSNIETAGIDLVSLLGRQVQIGEVILLINAPRDPCEKMDAICLGLMERMMNNRQGVMAQVLRTGKLRVGDTIRPL